MMLSKPERSVLCALSCGLLLACESSPRRFVGENGGGSGVDVPERIHRTSTSTFGVRVKPDGLGGASGQQSGKAYFASSQPFMQGDSGGSTSLGASLYCGDGIRDVVPPLTEECDDGVGSEADLCTERCQVEDTAVVPLPETPPGPTDRAIRYLGEGRHPVSASERGFGVAFVESHVEPPVVGLSIFDPAGDPREHIPVSTGASPVLFANPVVAALPSGDYAVAWTDFDVDGAVLGVAIRRVTPEGVPNGGADPPLVGAALGATLSPLTFANEQTFFSQLDADVLAVGDTLIVAWTDTTEPETAPDLRFRTFKTAGAPGTAFVASGSDKVLSDSEDVEGNVALAAFGTTWAAAWRASTDAGDETIKVSIGGGDVKFITDQHLAGEVEDHPALAELDEDRLLLVYTIGTDPGGAGIASVPRLRGAILDIADPETVTPIDLSPTLAGFEDPAIAQSHPSLVRAGNDLYVAWRSGDRVADSEAENVFLRAFTWVGGELVAGATEYRMPRWPGASFGDQRFPALAVGPRQLGTPGLPEPAPFGALVLAWDDYGQRFGAAQGRPDVLVQHWPLPIVRFDEPRRTDCSPGDPCGPGEGHCDDDSECQSGLVCLSGQGPQYGLPPGVSVCVPSHCTNGVQDEDETDVDCGGAQCGTCFCGDGIVFAGAGEDCDDMGESADCDADCTFAECGDGVRNAANDELCDDDNQIDTDSCRSTCVPAFCGDGVVWDGVEACDTAGATATCNADCTEPPGIWNPSLVSPVAWYEASPSYLVLQGTGVTQWLDRSGNDLHIGNPNGFFLPIHNATGWNGAKPTVTFNGASMLWREPWPDNLAPAGDGEPFTVLAVVRSTASHSGGIASWWNMFGGSNVWCQVKPDHGGETMLEVTRMDSLNRAQILRDGRHDLGTGRHVVAWRFSPEELKITVDGTTTTLPQDAIGLLNFTSFVMGATSMFGTSLLQADVSEVVVVPSALSDLDVSRYRAYAQQTWGGLPTASPPPSPCTTAGGQPSLPSKACDDGNPATYGDRCQAGTCVGTVPPPESPAQHSPVAWYVASSSEITLDPGSAVAQWFDRSGHGNHVMQANPGFKPTFGPLGWNESKPTLTFNGMGTLRKGSWSGSPEGDDSAFTMLAVMRSAQPQSAGPAGWSHFNGYWWVAPQVEAVNGETRLSLLRQDDYTTQTFAGTTDIKTERHVIAWRYSPEVMKLTVDGTTVSSANLASLNPLHIDTWLVGVSHALGFNPFRGDISELVAIPSSITDDDVIEFTNYARATWGGLPACGFGPGDTQCQASEYCDDDGLCKPRPCNLSDPFISLTSVFPSNVSADGITFSTDGLTAYVSLGPSNGPGDLYFATRPNTNSAFGTLTIVPNVNHPTHDDRGPWLSKDGLRLYFSTTNTATGDPDLVVSTRTSTSSAFGAPQPLPTVNYATDLDEQPHFAPEEQLLYFSSQRAPTGHDIYYSTHANGSFSAPELLSSVNSTYEDSHPVVSRDGLRIYFRSKRIGPDGDSDGSIYMAERASTSASFGTASFLATLNTSGNEFPVALSADGCSLFIGTNRHTGLGGTDVFRLYEVKRGTPPANFTITMVVTGNGTGSVGAPFNCSIGQTCPVEQPFGTQMIVWGSRTTYWSGGCAANGAPGLSTDGVVSFTIDPVCTVQFP